MLGFSEDELRRKHRADLSPPEDAEKDWELFRQLRAGSIDHYQLEKRYLRRDGSLIWGRLSISLLNSHPSPLVIAMVEDITEQKTTEKARFRHAAVVESSEDAIISKNLDAVIVSWNAGAQRIFGYTETEAVGQPITILIPPELRDEESQILERLRAGGRIEHYETIRVTKTGRTVNVSLTIGPVKDSTGKIVGFSKIAHDITERKRAEEAVKESEQRFRLVADAVPVLIWMSGTDKLCTYFNRPWLNFTGRSMESELGSGWTEGVHSEDLQRCMDTYSRAFDHCEEFRMEYRLRRNDGEYRWVLDIGVPRFNQDHSFAGYIGSCIDVTEHIRTEEALRKSEERLRMAQWAAHIGTFDVNIQTGVDTWTPETEALYGLPPGGFGGTLTAFENLIHPDDRQRIIELTHEMLRTGKPTEGEWRVVWPDGSVHWIAGRGQVLMDDSGEPSRMIGVNMDVTEYKVAERELSRANERLRLAIESGSAGGWDYDLKTGKNVWFGRAHEQLGTTRGETPGSPEEFWDRVHEEDRERVRGAMQTARHKNGEFTQEFRVVWRDGTVHWLRSRGQYHCAANGEPERFLGISVDITQSKQTEQALRESEQRLRLAAQAGKMYSFEWDVSTDVVMRSPEHVEVLSVAEPLSLTHPQFVKNIHPDDRARFIATIAGLSPEKPIAEVTYRVVVPDGTAVWLKSRGHAFFDSDGRMLRVVGMVADITDLKRAEEELLEVNRRLIEAQEQERTRIGRELHDDMTQRLALLAIELNQFREKHRNLPSKAQSHMQVLEQMTSDISASVHALSRQLHPSTLEYLGLETGIRSWCKEFSERQKLNIDFQSHEVPELPQEISLCLFRVLQEALNNVSKHSGVRRVEVQLAAHSGEIHLIVSDSGKGFDVKAPGRRKGLGLTSMRERVRLVSGTIVIDSKPQAGTTIQVRVPIGTEHQFAPG
jgi:PAS domain S-box-containing protein